MCTGERVPESSPSKEHPRSLTSRREPDFGSPGGGTGLVWPREMKLAVQLFLCGLVGLVARDADAAPTCDAVQLCSAVPRDKMGKPSYNHAGSSAPWVIGANEDVVLAPGLVKPGIVPELGQRIIFVTEQGRLRIENFGAGQEVGVDAWIVLCDDAQLSLKNATLRFLQPSSFAYGIVARDRSTATFTEATLFGSDAAAPSGLFLPGYFCDDATVSVSPATNHGLAMPSSDTLEWVFSGTSKANIDALGAIGELYAEDRANVHIVNSGMFGMWLNPLPNGKPVSISGLPRVCDITGSQQPGANDPSDDCAWESATAPKTTYSSAAGALPFNLSLSDTWIFSWAVTTSPGSDMSLDVGPQAKLAIGVNLEASSYELSMRKGAQTTPPTGLTDRKLAFSPATSVFVWHVWGAKNVDFLLKEGSEVGDLLVAGTGHGKATGAKLADGVVTIEPEAHGAIIDSTLAEDGSVQGSLRLTRTSVSRALTVHSGGVLVLEDTAQPASLVLENGDVNAELVAVSLSAPESGASVTSPVRLRGTIAHRDSKGELPLSATLEVRDPSGNWTPVGSPLTTSVTDAELGTYTPPDGVCGDFEVRLKMAAPAKAEGDATVTHPMRIACGPDGTRADPSANGDSSDGCSCHLTGRSGGAGAGAGALGLLSFAFALARRRRRIFRTDHASPSPRPEADRRRAI